jgi:uncharacterized protein (TIGR00251 family)
LHRSECRNAGVRDCPDGEHWKVAHFAQPASAPADGLVVGRDRILAGEKRLIAIRESGGGVTFAVKVHPRAKKNAISGELGDALKLSLTAPPIDGKANQACVEFLAKLLKVPRDSVTIASGQTGRNKVIRVSGLSAEEVRTRIQM